MQRFHRFPLLVIILYILTQLTSSTSGSAASLADSSFRLNPDNGLPISQETNHPPELASHPFGGETVQQLSFTPSSPNRYQMEAVKQYEERSYYLKDLDFIDDNTGWAVGEPHWVTETQSYTGTIVKTTDGGLTWAAEQVGTLVTLRGVDFVDANNGWAVGQNGTILHTSDGGMQWNDQNVPADLEFRYVSFLDAQHGWATAMKPIHYDSWAGEADNWHASVWRTTDGGETWITGTLPITASVLNRIDFVDAQNGWTVGYRYAGDDEFGDAIQKTLILHTNDGGQSWETQFAPDLGYYLTSVDFVDELHGWAAGAPNTLDHTIGTVFHTSDGGLTWQNQPDVWGNFWDVHFLDVNRGYVVGLDYIGAWGPPVWRTMDGGTTWEEVRMEAEENDGLFGLALNEDRVVALGDHDFQVVSVDPWGPYSWPYGEELFTQSYINTHYTLKDVYFADENNGWAVGARTFVPSIWGQVILHTQDRGRTWNEQYSTPPFSLASFYSYQFLDSVYFMDTQHGWATGASKYVDADSKEHYYLLYTSDGGQTWTERGSELYPAATNIELLDIQFTSSQEGWALSANNPIVSLAHTIDGGVTWNWVSTGLDGSDLNFGGGLFFSDPQHGWIVGGLEDVYYTRDGGVTWATQDPPTYANRLHNVAFIDNQEGWIVGEAFYHTIDGGDHWNVIDVGLNRDLNAVQFVDSQHGVVAGDKGNFLYTEDGGDSWYFAINNVSTSTINGLHFITPQIGWLVGEQGTILTVVVTPVYSQFLPLIVR